MCQYVSKKLLVRGPKIKQKFQTALKIAFREGEPIHLPSNEGLRDIGLGHGMSMVLNTKKYILGCQQSLQFHFSVMALFKKYGRFIITKCDSFITKYDNYTKCEVKAYARYFLSNFYFFTKW